MTGLAAAPAVVSARDGARWAPVVFVAATAVGVVMRFVEVGWQVPVSFDHLLHAHSHALYFGWAGLVILSAATDGLPGRRSSAADPELWALILVPVMAATFLMSGYAPVSIAASTAVMVAWYLAIWRWWRWRRTETSPLLEAERAGFLYVVAASAGIWVLAPLQALDLGPPLASRLAIHAFLGTFAWFFVLGCAGLMLRTGLTAPGFTRSVVRAWAAVAWLTFPLGVLGGPEVPLLGAVARMAGVLLLVPTAAWAVHVWRRAGDVASGESVRLAVVWLGVAAGGLAAVSAGGSDVLAAADRHGIVLYLHALLLGYVTTLLAWYLARRAAVDIRVPLLVHHAGVATMLVGLGLAVLGGSWLVAGLWLAAAGASMTWCAGCRWAWQLWRAGR